MTHTVRTLAFLLAACAPSLVAQGPAPRKLEFNDLAAIAPKVGSLRATPTTITLRVGEIVQLDSIAVIVLDSTGRVLGRLMGYDFGIQPNQAASVEPRKITGVRPGTTELVVHFPRNAWKPRPDPRAEAKVKIVVKPWRFKGV